MPRVLVIDDYPGVVQLLAWCLGKCGYQVFTASTGIAGLKVAREHRIQFALVGFSLPAMDGVVFCETVKRDPQLRDLAVALMTGTPTPALQSRAEAAGALAVLGKPFDWNQLLDLLTLHLPLPSTEGGPEERAFSESLRHSRLRTGQNPANTYGQPM